MNEELVVKLVDLKGSHYQFGLKQSKEILSSALSKQMDFLNELTIASNSQIAQQVLQEVSPNILQELEGLAFGLNMPLHKIIQLFSGYDIMFPEMGCTALVHDGYYVRNYDFSPDMYDARLVFSNPLDGYASVGFSQSVLGRLDGMNEKGLVVGLHFVHNEHRGEGFIAPAIVRMVLEQCENIEEAIEFMTKLPHGYCYNYSLTDRSGKGIVVEATPRKQVIHSDYPQVCTNHFEAKELVEKNRAFIEGSMKRKEYVNSLLLENLSALSAYHHFNNGESPVFFKHYKEYFGTLHTVLYSPKDLEMIVGIGENCEPMKFSLKKYIKGTLILPEYIMGRINQPT
ncbi:linear amide C-N hydrolase [Bacillus sp. Bva_UNVM-123]|uniref:C45 family autoproteolytic acyltransferase/hydolase n=1 Tax=Bacillus sp. Bva_UNVM-123 TaxID=2829798 RepID=UPI00391F7020